jgi:GMP synthase-like glutamine amidotransferase
MQNHPLQAGFFVFINPMERYTTNGYQPKDRQQFTADPRGWVSRLARETRDQTKPTILVVQARNPGRLEQEMLVFDKIGQEMGVRMRYLNLLKLPVDYKLDLDKLFADIDGVVFAGSDLVNLAEQDNPYTKTYLKFAPKIAETAIKHGTRNENPLPVLGICLGHQLLHFVTGGNIENDKAREETATGPVTLNGKETPHPYLQGVDVAGTTSDAKTIVEFILGHNSSVIKPGEGFRVIGTTPKDPYSITIRGNVFTMQSHPEIDDVTALEEAFRAIDQRRNDGSQQYIPNYPLKPTPTSKNVLRNYCTAVSQYHQTSFIETAGVLKRKIG